MESITKCRHVPTLPSNTFYIVSCFAKVNTLVNHIAVYLTFRAFSPKAADTLDPLVKVQTSLSTCRLHTWLWRHTKYFYPTFHFSPVKPHTAAPPSPDLWRHRGSGVGVPRRLPPLRGWGSGSENHAPAQPRSQRLNYQPTVGHWIEVT